MQNLVKTEIPPKKKREKKTKTKVLVFISYFLYHLYKGGTSNTQESQKSFLPYIVVMWQFQHFRVDFLFYFEHFMSKIRYSKYLLKKSIRNFFSLEFIFIYLKFSTFLELI
jgi:hypothetical protein